MSFLDWIIPPAIFILLGLWLYKVFKPMFEGIFAPIKRIFQKKSETPMAEEYKSVVYE